MGTEQNRTDTPQCAHSLSLLRTEYLFIGPVNDVISLQEGMVSVCF